MTGPVTVAPTATPAAARRRVARLLDARRGGVFAVVVVTAASTAATLAGPALIGVVIDAARDGAANARSTVLFASSAYALLAILSALLAYAATVRAAVVGESALAELRSEVFDHAVEVPIDVIERAGTGDLVSRVTGDVTVLSNAVRWTVPSVVFATIEVALTLVALAVVDVRLALVAVVAGTPPAAIGGWWYARRAPIRYRREREAHATLTTRLLEAYRGRTTLAAYRAAGRARNDIVDVGRRVVDAEMATTAARNRLRPSVSLSLAMALAATVATGAVLVDAGAVTVGAVTAAALYVVRLFDPIGTLLEELDEVQQAVAATARLVGVTELPTSHTSTGSPIPTVEPQATAGSSLSMSDVSFSYVSGSPVLRGVTLDIDAAERIVVVGASGAGKSTLVKLLAGLHQPDTGSVVVGEHRLDAVSPIERARLVAMVAQEPYVFARSVADNVRLARCDAADDTIQSVLRTVDADHWVAALPDGIDTIVGASGVRLTPPQAQQLALARLVCADPAVVILDEATADLDPLAAARTERHLDTALAGRTVITVAHRLDTVTTADRVMVMEAGTIIACGPHQELLDHSDRYRELWNAWNAQRHATSTPS